MMPELPPEILILIIAFAVTPLTPFKDRSRLLKSFSLVSGTWTDAAQAQLLSVVEIKTARAAALLLEFIRKRSDRLMAIKTLQIGAKHAPHKYKVGEILLSCKGLKELSLINVGTVELKSIGHAKALRSLSLSYLNLENETGPPKLKSLSFPHLTQLALRHVDLRTPALLLRPSTLPRITSLTLRHTCPSIKSFVDAFDSIAPQLTSLSLDLHKDDHINTHFYLCVKLTLLRYFPTTSTANLLEGLNRSIIFLQLDSKTGANKSAITKATADIVKNLEYIGLSELKAIYVPESWYNFPLEKKLLRDYCAERAIALRECGSDAIAMAAICDRDYE